MKVIIIGGVAGGSSTAAKLSRLVDNAQITIYDELSFISYSSCNMPYIIGDLFDDEESIYPRDAAYFKRVYNTDVKTRTRVLKIDKDNKKVLVKDLVSGEEYEDNYDYLVISTGARNAAPPIVGLDRDNVFRLRVVEDMEEIKRGLSRYPENATAIVIGAGFIGLEMVDSFRELGLNVKLLVMSKVSNLSPEMSVYLEEHIKKNGVEIIKDASATEITDEGVKLKDGRFVRGDFVFVATGAKPNVELAQEIGIEIGEKGAIKVDCRMRTNVPDIYACGDCTETTSIVSGKPIYVPLGSTANKMGRVVADNIAGVDSCFNGIVGTSIFKLFDMTVASTGMNEAEVIKEGYDYMVYYHTTRSHYAFHGGEPMLVKAVVDKKDLKLLGVEIIGFEGVLARIDTYATFMTFGGKIDELEELDLAYAPPYSTVRDVVLYTGMIGMNLYEKNTDHRDDRLQEAFLDYVKNRK